MDPINGIIQQLLTLAPAPLLATVLFFVGRGLKRSTIADWVIPFVCGAAGFLFYPLVASYVPGKPLVTQIALSCIHGFGIGALPTWLHQGVKQFREREKTPEGKTEFIVKGDGARSNPVDKEKP